MAPAASVCWSPNRLRQSKRHNVCHTRLHTCVKHVGSSARLVKTGLAPQRVEVVQPGLHPPLVVITKSAEEPACRGEAWDGDARKPGDKLAPLGCHSLSRMTARVSTAW